MKKRKLISLLLCAAMVLAIIPPAGAYAAGSDFTVEGGTPGNDYTYGIDGVLEFIEDGEYTVTMTTPGTTTNTDRIKVASFLRYLIQGYDLRLHGLFRKCDCSG